MHENAGNIKISDVKNIIQTLWENDRSPLLLGDRGIGKSQVAEQVAREEMDLPIYYLNCSQIDAESLVYPSIKQLDNDENRKAIDLITIDGLEKPTVVLLDEITNARPSLWSLLLSFVAEKRIGSHHFPNVKFIATGNRIDNSSLAQPLPRPLLERFCIIDAPVPTIAEWTSYMQERFPKVPAYHYGFVMGLPSQAFYEKESGGGDIDDFSQQPSPRSHTYAASVLANFPTIDDARNSLAYLHTIFKGYLGDAVASRFVAYLQDADNFLTYKDYKQGKKPSNPAQIINLCIDAAEKLIPMHEKDEEKYFQALDEIMIDVHTGKFTSLTIFALDSLTGTTEDSRALKAEYVHWGRYNESSKIHQIINERRKMLDEASDEFGWS